MAEVTLISDKDLMDDDAPVINKARVHKSMRTYFYSDLRWISWADDNYGHQTENASESAGTGVNPIFEWENRGIPFKAGDVIKSIEVRGRVNNTEITDIEMYLVYCHPTSLLTATTGMDNDNELTTIDLYRDMWKTPLNGQLPFTHPINDEAIRVIDLDYTVLRDGDLRLFYKPVGANTATRYFYSSMLIDYELA